MWLKHQFTNIIKQSNYNYKLINDLKLAYKKTALQHHYCKTVFLDNASSITVSN